MEVLIYSLWYRLFTPLNTKYISKRGRLELKVMDKKPFFRKRVKQMTTFTAYGFTQRTLEFIMFSLVAPLVLPSKIYVKTRYYVAKSKILYVLRFLMTIIHILFIIGQCNTCNRMLLEKLVHTFIIGLRNVKKSHIYVLKPLILVCTLVYIKINLSFQANSN